jgi:hypothetical protein
MNIETKIFKGIIVRRIENYPSYWASEDGRILGPTNTWRKYKKRADGYFQISAKVNGKATQLTVHRLIALAWCDKPDDCDQVDHKDGNRENNNAENLRWVTRRQNSHNQRIHRNGGSTSKFIGVCSFTQTNQWRAQITINKKFIHLGLFDTEELAAEAYQNALNMLNNGTVTELVNVLD